MFQYTPGEIAELAQGIATSASQLENIRSSAQNALVAVREEFEGVGGGSFEHAQMLINSGIDEGVAVCQRHGTTVEHVLDEMVNTDIVSGHSFGGF
jgi:uncharacterized protein YukE